ncbi:MAG: deoxyribose-phosphate aldolase [Clostridiales bacterium]|nr:deoxyribose-phosphate aldolase [Clostridiales bacterium]
MAVIDKKTMASMIDHTILKAGATKEQIVEICSQAKEYNFASVCVSPCFVKLAAKELKDSKVKVCTVIGFPLGANSTQVKAFEAKKAVEEGAHEVDMVIQVGALKEGDFKYVQNDISEVVKASEGAHIKVIIETCYLTDEEKIKTCEIAKKAGANFVKTSTGFGTGGATASDIELMRKTVGDELGVKASGGVRSLQEALVMIKAGANRIGTSSGVSILKEMN